MTRSTLCTASLFVAAIVLLGGSWFVRMPDYLTRWIVHEPEATTRLPLWLAIYVCGLYGVVGFSVILTRGLWLACAALCEWLRREPKP